MSLLESLEIEKTLSPRAAGFKPQLDVIRQTKGKRTMGCKYRVGGWLAVGCSTSAPGASRTGEINNVSVDIWSQHVMRSALTQRCC